MAQYLNDIDKAVWARYVLVPGHTDHKDDLHALGRFLKPMSNVQKLEIQPYHKLGMHKYDRWAGNTNWKEWSKILPNNCALPAKYLVRM